MSKVIRDCIGFALLRSVIGPENSRHPLSQSDAELKPIVTWLLAFSRAWNRLHVFTLSSHWLLVISTFVRIGRCDYFGFGFTTLNRKALYQNSIPRRSTQFSNGRLVCVGPSSSRGLAAVIVNIGPEDQKILLRISLLYSISYASSVPALNYTFHLSDMAQLKELVLAGAV